MAGRSRCSLAASHRCTWRQLAAANREALLIDVADVTLLGHKVPCVARERGGREHGRGLGASESAYRERSQ